MASEDEAADGPPKCNPCRGTGKLISNLGGEPHEVSCSWCDGTGEFRAGHDAQAANAEAPANPQNS